MNLLPNETGENNRRARFKFFGNGLEGIKKIFLKIPLIQENILIVSKNRKSIVP